MEKKTRPMIRSLRLLLPVFLLCALLSACRRGDWSLDYSKTAKVGAWDVALDPDGKKAFAAAYVWDGSEEGRRVVVPDEVEGCIVYTLGGYFGRGLPMPFYVFMPLSETETDGSGEETATPREERTEELVFTLVLGPYLENIRNIRESEDFAVDKEDGTRVIYHPVFLFEVDEKNPVYHTDDRGRLYSNKNVLITDFEYPSERKGP